MDIEKNKAYQATIMKKWSKVINAAGKIKDPVVMRNTALVMESTENLYRKAAQNNRQLNESWAAPSMGAQPGALPGGPANGGGALGATNDYGVGDSRVPSVIIPMIRRTFPELIANEIMAVQPMGSSVGRAYALRFLYGSDSEGSSNAGKEMGYNNMYSAHTGVTGLVEDSQNERDQYVNEDLDSDGSADEAYRTPTTTANTFWAAYSGSNADNFNGQGATLADSEFWKIGEEMPTAAIKLVSGIVEAKTRKLATSWSRELAEDMQQQHGLDVEAEMIGAMSSEIGSEIDRQCISECVFSAINGTAGKHNSSWSPATADGRNQLERISTLYTQFGLASKRIAVNSRRGPANWAVSDTNVSVLLERAGDFKLDGAADGVKTQSGSIVKNGSFKNGQVKLYSDSFGGDYLNGQGYVLLGHKGSSNYDSGVVYCPYIPIEATSVIGTDDLNPRVGLRTRYGMLSNLNGSANYYHMIRIHGLTATVLGEAADTKVFAF